MKNPLTPARIEPATSRFVAQHLNHCATAVPNEYCRQLKHNGKYYNIMGSPSYMRSVVDIKIRYWAHICITLYSGLLSYSDISIKHRIG